MLISEQTKSNSATNIRLIDYLDGIERRLNTLCSEIQFVRDDIQQIRFFLLSTQNK